MNPLKPEELEAFNHAPYSAAILSEWCRISAVIFTAGYFSAATVTASFLLSWLPHQLAHKSFLEVRLFHWAEFDSGFF